ncbi:MAG: hypothetical protein E5W82_10550 [Mesorhizobium sp.]|nr:MAG: hypothetical protein E5W82_10550 [Mesorhizobium sp.]
MANIITTTETLGFHVESGTVIVTTAETMGETHEGREVTCPPGSVGVVQEVTLPSTGLAVIVRIDADRSPDTGEDTHIINLFESGDQEPRFPFVRADAVVRDMLATLKLAEERLGINNCEGEEDGNIATIRDAIAKAEGAPGGKPVDHAKVGATLANVARYDAALDDAEISPNGDDYNAIMGLLHGAEYSPPHTKGR